VIQVTLKGSIKPILVATLLISVIFSGMSSTMQFASAASYYTVSVSGSTYTAKNPSGTVLYSGTSAASAIKKAVSSVPSGGTIYIYSGTYPCSSQILGSTNSVTITGDSTAVIKATASMGYLFVWTGTSSKHLTAFTLSKIVFDGNLLSAGLSVKWVDNAQINGITIKNTAKRSYVNGMEIKGSSGSTVKGISVTGCIVTNIYASGVAMQYVTDSKISSNTFVDCAQYYPSGGAILGDAGCQRITAQYNNISGRSDNDGIYMGTQNSFASGCVITDNTINLRLYGKGGGAQYAGSGIKIYTLSSEVARNTIEWNDTPYVYGIQNYGTGNNIHDNKVSNSRVGIGCQSTFRTGGSTVTYNRISGCYKGIEVNQTGVYVASNTIIDCTTDLQVKSGNTVVSNTLL
jgi:hypothetical protein